MMVSFLYVFHLDCLLTKNYMKTTIDYYYRLIAPYNFLSTLEKRE
ncbi:hypothetical protein [Niallia circulans]|nr:hypothetical protein [Niallia circulans]